MASNYGYGCYYDDLKLDETMRFKCQIPDFSYWNKIHITITWKLTDLTEDEKLSLAQLCKSDKDLYNNIKYHNGSYKMEIVKRLSEFLNSINRSMIEELVFAPLEMTVIVHFNRIEYLLPRKFNTNFTRHTKQYKIPEFFWGKRMYVHIRGPDSEKIQ